ncbi:MAG: hypothetical protein QM783_17620 [Phycisphaerales bacterium]
MGRVERSDQRVALDLYAQQAVLALERERSMRGRDRSGLEGDGDALAHAGLAEGILDRAGVKERAAFDDADGGGHLGEFGQDVRADHDALAHPLELKQELAQFDAGAGIEAAGRFVKQQHGGLMQQHAGDPQSLLHAA